MAVASCLPTSDFDWQFAFDRSELLRDFQTELLVSISHELRNPLSSQMGALQLILSDLCDSPDEERDYLVAAQQAVERSLSLLTELTQLARLQLPIQPLTLEPLSLQMVLNNVYQLTVLQAKDQGIRYRWPVIGRDWEDLEKSEESAEIIPDLDWLVEADIYGLTQALLGLIRLLVPQLQYGSFLLYINAEDPVYLKIIMTLSGGIQISSDLQSSLAWRVCSRLLLEMKGDLNLNLDLDPATSTSVSATLVLMKASPQRPSA